MSLVLLYFIFGFIGHFILLFADEREMEDFKTYTFKNKFRLLLLNMTLGYFTFAFAIFTLGVEIYLIERENYKQKHLNKPVNEENIVDDYDYHHDHTKYL